MAIDNIGIDITAKINYEQLLKYVLEKTEFDFNILIEEIKSEPMKYIVITLD